MMLIAACHLWHREKVISSSKSSESEKSHLFLISNNSEIYSVQSLRTCGTFVL